MPIRVDNDLVWMTAAFVVWLELPPWFWMVVDWIGRK